MTDQNDSGRNHDRSGRQFLLLLCFMLHGTAAQCRQSPVRAPSVQKVENAGLLFTDNPAGVSGVDAGYSLPVGTRTLWLFGDVFLLAPTDPARPYVSGVSNCGLLLPTGPGPEPLRRYTFLTDPRTGVARPLLPNLPGEGNEIRYWPFGGWYDAGAKRVYLYYARIRTTGGGALDFRIEGHGLAVADAADPASLLFRRLDAAPGQRLWWTEQPNAAPALPPGQPPGQSASQPVDLQAGQSTDKHNTPDPPAKSPLFGSAVVAGTTDGFLYIVGVQERGGSKRGKLARVPKRQVADLRAYEYFAGRLPDGAAGWSRSVSDAADIDGLNDFPNELSVAYNPYLGGWLAVHSVNVSDRVRLSLAPHPWGPYKPIGEIGAPHRAFARAFCYAGKEHLELRQASGRILYITYVDSDRYWLQLLKVTLQK